jgi:hypothetical protein
MPTIQKLPSGNYQIVVRLINLKPIYTTFPTKAKTKKWTQADTALASGGDMWLQLAVHNGSCKCLVPYIGDWIDTYIANTDILDISSIGQLRYWQKQFERSLITDINPENINGVLLGIADKRTGSIVNQYKSNRSSVFLAFNKDHLYKRLKLPNPVRSEFVSSCPENPPKNRFLSLVEQKTLLNFASESNWDRLYLLALMAFTTSGHPV